MSGKKAHTAERRCILTGRTRAAAGLLRLAEDPDGRIVADVAGKLPGRGAWISLDRAGLEKALANGELKRALSRALKRRVGDDQIDPDLGAQIDGLLARKALDRLGLERKAGRLVTGFDSVARRLKKGRVAVLLTARDAAEDSRRKIAAGTAGAVAAYSPFDRTELSLALGGENVVHAAVEPGPATDRLTAELDRLVRFRGQMSGADGWTTGRPDGERKESARNKSRYERR